MKAIEAVRDIIRLLKEIRDELRRLNSQTWYVPPTVPQPPPKVWPHPDSGTPRPWPGDSVAVYYGCQTAPMSQPACPTVTTAGATED